MRIRSQDHGRIPRGVAGVLLCLMAITGTGVAADTKEIVDPFAVVAALDRFAEMPLWPDFRPSEHPLAIYDGERTLLFRHPSPPGEFGPLEGHAGVSTFAGKHEAIVWNSVVDLGGVRTATLVLTIEPGREVAFEASVLLHEVFHVFSKPRHPAWSPNEMHRYSYPLDDLENYTLLLLEEEALARALESEDAGVADRWAAAALRWRRQRTRALAKEHVGYETAQEMQEGTAVYVARLALGSPRDTTRLREARSPEKLRWRYYDTGAALAALLDVVDPAWKRRVEVEPGIAMDTILQEALERRDAEPAQLAAPEIATIRAAARKAVKETKTRRARLRKDFLARGPRIIVTVSAGTAPLRQRGFDPLALEILDRGEALHSHRLTLRGPNGQMEFENPGFRRDRLRRGSFDGVAVLTVPAGTHPFLDGVRRVTISGFAGEPEVSVEEGRVTVEAEGLRLSFEDAEVRTVGQQLRIVLGAPGP